MGKARMMRSRQGGDDGWACPPDKRPRGPDEHARPSSRVTVGRITRALPSLGTTMEPRA